MIRSMTGLATFALLAAFSLTASAQTPPKKDATKGPEVRDHRGLKVQITMDHMHCLKTTERSFLNNRDEVFLVVAGKAPAGTFHKRLPGAKDYYGFKKGQKAGTAGWKNKSGKEMGRPMLWSGNLKPGEHVRLSMLMIEQDKKILPNIVGKVAGVFGKIAGIATGILGGDNVALGTLNKGITAAQKAIKADGNDYLGCVTVVVKNVNGKLQVKYVAGPKTKDLGNDAVAKPFGPNAHTFDMTASGARYKPTLNVK